MLFNSPRGLASGTSVAADVLMGITKPTNNKGITLALSPWVWTGIRYDLYFFPCGHLSNLTYLINPSHDPPHFLEGLPIALMLFDAFVLYCYRLLGPVDTTSWPLFTTSIKAVVDRL